MTRKDLRPRQRLGATARTQTIIDAAAAQFARMAYAEVTVAGIAREAEASEALVYRYFDTKAALYAQVVRRAVEELSAAQQAAVAALHPRTPVQAKLRAALAVYLDHIAGHPHAWAGLDAAQEPAEALAVRAHARAAAVDDLAAMLTPNPSARHRYALWGHYGFLDGACLAWARAGCPADDRSPLIEAALGGLEGALGDWAA